METWRLLPFHRGAPADHVALTDALVRCAIEPTVWWHAASRPTLILGAGQREQTSGRPHAVRRFTGGTAVLADHRLLGLDIAIPRPHHLADADILESYRWLGEVWVTTLESLGVDSRTVSIAEARADSVTGEFAHAVRAACFGMLSPYEVVADGRKLVGFAQVRRRAGILLQAGVHLSFDSGALADALTDGDSSPLAAELRRRAVGLDELICASPEDPTEVDPARIREAFTAALEQRMGIVVRPGEWRAEELAHAELDAAAWSQPNDSVRVDIG